MPDWHQVLARLTAEVEDYLDRARYSLAEVVDRDRAIRIAGYRGYGTEHSVLVRGRVLRDRSIGPASPDDPWWRNLHASYLRLESDEVPGARVRIRYLGAETEAVADEEGHFRLWLEHPSAEDVPRGWHPASVRLLEPEPPDPVASEVPVLVPSARADFGVISDIDDTLVRTDATNVLATLRHVLLGNAHTRLPFPGVAALCRALHAGRTGEQRNPLFYVSSSPWNLYDVLASFFRLHGIPPGPLALRDWGVTRDELLPVGHRRHKLREIRDILDTYDELPFVLMGDSGQEDPEIYREVVRAHPGRIHAVYIRTVVSDPAREARIDELAREIEAAGSTLILAERTQDVAEHAARHGWIAPDAPEAVRAAAAEAAARRDSEPRGV